MRGKPDVRAFLDGGAAAAGEITPISSSRKATRPAAKERAPAGPKRQKLVELPEAVFTALKDRAYQEWKKTGRRVTETELIIAALSAYLDVNG